MATNASPTQAPRFNQQLDNLPLSRFHWKLLFVSGLGWMFDAMDILIVSSVVAAVAREWNLDATASQWINSANVAGLFFGALASGWLADRIWVAESALTEEDVYQGAALAACEMIRNGIVAFADHYFWWTKSRASSKNRE